MRKRKENEKPRTPEKTTFKVVRDDTEPEGVSIGRLQADVNEMYDPYVKVMRDLSICQKCPKFHVNHVRYGCRRHCEPEESRSTPGIVDRARIDYYPFSATEEEMKNPENQPFFCEEYDEYWCMADGGCGYKKDWFEHAIVNKKCVCYTEQYLNAVNKMNKEKKDGMV